MRSTENELRNFLLGQLPDEESEDIETQLLADEDFYVNVRGVEDDLFDAFARGELAAGDRQAFQQRYGGQTDRIAFARALATRPSNVVRMPARRWIGWAAAAAAAIVIAILVWSPQPQAPSPAVTAQNNAGALLRSVAVTVALEQSRGASTPAEIIVPGDVSMVRLRVRLNPYDRYDGYTAELRSKTAQWRGDNLHASLEAGDLILLADVPARALPDGSCELSVRGGGEDLGFVTVEVQHRQ